jgi:AmmeMemoRadiSam system radical SAM enzyme/AmmeMemoRadiSam system protein B/AmmeMemoRadiSam system protein A
MSQLVTLPPESELLPDGAKLGGWWHAADDAGRVVCDLCPRACHLKPGDRGFCFVRENRDGRMVLGTYGRSTGFCVDPIEKKPLNHFFPGTSILSFGTAGCNLGCKFCQNWDISKSREVERLSEYATPEMIAEAARQLNCLSVAYTYNDPVIWAEYAIDTARACRAVGVRSVAVTAGYIMPAAREAFFREMDAANVDLKAFTEEFYFKLTYSHLQPVLDTLHWLKHETDVWFEITNLVIPGENDSADELRSMCDWILASVGDEVPVHFTAFHPDFRMRDKPPTPLATLLAAYDIARSQGIKYAYVGNVDDLRHQSTYCPHCGELLIERNWYDLGVYRLRGDRCGKCGGKIAGRFQDAPGDWGRKRLPVRISQFAAAATPRTANKETEGKEHPVAAKPETGQKATAVQAADPGNVPSGPEVTGAQEAAIHRAACEVVAAGVQGRPPQLSDPTLAGCAGQMVMGAFVTLKRNGHLRACCGVLGRPMRVLDAVQQSALRTATEDSRFPTISTTELPHLHLDVTLLYGFEPIEASGRERVKHVAVGRHGLHISRGNSAGLLLPVVAVENGWDAEQFLEHVCRKAGLPTTAWQDDQTRLLRFAGHMVPGEFDPGVLTATTSEKPLRFAAADLQRLADQCRQNVLALVRGATPNYYLPGCPDGTVEVIALSVRVGDQAEPSTFSQLSLRPGVPLQATLFTLCETAAKTLVASRLAPADLNGVQVGLTLLYDPAMHGTASAPDLGGVNPQRRAVLVVEYGRSAWVFDPSRTVQQLLQTASQAAQVASPAQASVFSLAAQSTERSIQVSSVPRPRLGPQVRPPAVAGAFYPGEPGALQKMIDGLLADGDVQPAAWPGVLVPHAGLIYSGRLAAQTFRRVRIPETVIIIAPKHTRQGVDFAVAPHDTWALPGGSIASDPELARRLAAEVPGLQLDAAAHQQEHAIEVQLPILARLAPHSRVVGITLGAGDLNRCRQLGTALANMLRSIQPRPLLVISSDMNHYASDQENRRLDELALQSVETLDPAAVYDTVVARHNISMCGVRPAIVVMEALRQLDLLGRCVRVGYDTSAAVSGDTSRVVGYAGLLFGAAT